MTLHRIFQLPIEHGRTPVYTALGDTAIQSIRSELQDVVFFIIDEISMVSNQQEVSTAMYEIQRLTNISFFCDICNREQDQWRNDEQKAVKMNKRQENHSPPC